MRRFSNKIGAPVGWSQNSCYGGDRDLGMVCSVLHHEESRSSVFVDNFKLLTGE